MNISSGYRTAPPAYKAQNVRFQRHSDDLATAIETLQKQLETRLRPGYALDVTGPKTDLAHPQARLQAYEEKELPSLFQNSDIVYVVETQQPGRRPYKMPWRVLHHTVLLGLNGSLELMKAAKPDSKAAPDAPLFESLRPLETTDPAVQGMYTSALTLLAKGDGIPRITGTCQVS